MPCSIWKNTLEFLFLKLFFNNCGRIFHSGSGDSESGRPRFFHPGNGSSGSIVSEQYSPTNSKPNFSSDSKVGNISQSMSIQNSLDCARSTQAIYGGFYGRHSGEFLQRFKFEPAFFRMREKSWYKNMDTQSVFL